MRTTLLVLLAALIAAADPTPADPARVGKANELVALLGIDAQLRDQALAAFELSIADDLKKLEAMPEPQRSAMTKALDEARDMIRTQIDWPAVAAGTAAGYAAAFTANELDAMLAFYRSPAGSRLATLAPGIARQATTEGQAKVTALMPRIAELVSQRINAAVNAAADAERAKVGIEVGKPFPALAEKATDGRTVDLAKLKGKVVLIDFWATWCGPCVAELPNVIAAYRDLHGTGFEVVGISLDEDLAKLARFTADKKMEWPQICDGKAWKADLAQRCAVKMVPTTLLIGRDGTLVASNLRGEALRTAIEKALAAPAP